MPKEVIAVDFDDVGVRHAEGFVAFSNERHGTSLTTADYHEDWGTIWGVEPGEVERRKLDFFTPTVLGTFGVIEGAKEGMAELAKNYELVVVTSRRETCRGATMEAIDQHFSGLITDVHFTTWFDESGAKHTRPKAQICQEIGAISLIDDQPRHCASVAEVGIRSVLFDSYNWNANFVGSDLITRVNTWPEVVEHFRARD